MSDNLEQRLAAIIGYDWRISVSTDSVTLEPPRSMYAQATVTMAMLEAIAAVVGTKNINLSYNAGWCGTDVTPGDPAEFAIVCKLEGTSSNSPPADSTR